MDIHCQHLRLCDNRDDTVSRLRDDALNGPRVASFSARTFSEMWVKEGPQAADDPSTGKQKKQTEVRHQSRLFS